MNKMLKYSLTVALVLVIAIAAILIFADKTPVVNGETSALTAAMTAAEQTGAGNEGSYIVTTEILNELKPKTAEATFKYDLSKIANDAKYSRAFKISGVPEGGADYHLFATETYKGDIYAWDCLNNLEAIQNEQEENGATTVVTGGTALYGKLTEEGKDYVGYWGKKAGNVKGEPGEELEGKFFFMANKAGTYTVTMDIVDYGTGAVISSYTVKFVIKLAA